MYKRIPCITRFSARHKIGEPILPGTGDRYMAYVRPLLIAFNGCAWQNRLQSRPCTSTMAERWCKSTRVSEVLELPAGFLALTISRWMSQCINGWTVPSELFTVELFRRLFRESLDGSGLVRDETCIIYCEPCKAYCQIFREITECNGLSVWKCFCVPGDYVTIYVE